MMVTCCPDISLPLIKLSQFNGQPAKIYYEELKHLFKYLKATIDDGLYYWRPSARPDLPFGEIPPT